MESHDEAVLLEQALALEPDALGQLYDHYAPGIYRYLYRRVGDARLAEDLTGQCFLNMLEALQRGGGWQSSFSGWLYRIAHNLSVDHFRRHGNNAFVELDERLLSGADSPDYVTDRALRMENVRDALHCLTDEQVQVILLRFGEGLSNKEVADMMGKTEGAIKALQHRALRALRRLLLEDVEADDL
ncbi:MAG: sigma-70 family RNA polymerase sigma factor [Ardenticatenaceae bacterium]|nr:sigma-70 family RNA polymerase sigma factor [Ardenticatenaceae bacterium]